MSINRAQSEDLLTVSRLPVRLLVAIVMIGHGLIHVMGFVLFMRLGQPGDLRYSGAVPEPGTTAGIVSGILWLVAAALFLTSAVLLLARRPRWRWLALGGAIISIPLVLMNLQMALFGLILDIVLLALLAAAFLSRMRRNQRAEADT